MEKQFMVEQLAARIQEIAEVAEREQLAAAAEAKDGATPDEKRADSRIALEFSNLAHAQGQRARSALNDLAILGRFQPPSIPEAEPRVSMGAIVEIEDGDQGRTLFLAPVGAGIELTMPDGDGHLTVVTGSSPLGKAIRGQCIGDTVEVDVNGDTREWTVTYVA